MRRLLGHYDIHRYVVVLRLDGFDMLQRIADADDRGFVLHRRQGAVKEAATIAQPVAGPVEADHRGNRNVWNDRLAVRRDRDVPDTLLERITGAVGAEDQKRRAPCLAIEFYSFFLRRCSKNVAFQRNMLKLFWDYHADLSCSRAVIKRAAATPASEAYLGASVPNNDSIFGP